MAKLSGIDLHDFGTTFKALPAGNHSGNSAYGEIAPGSFGVGKLDGRKNSGTADRQRRGERRQKKVWDCENHSRPSGLIIVKFLLDYSTRPGQFFGLVGVGSTALSVLLWLVLALDKFYFHIALIKDWGPVMFLAVALFLVGIQFISMGLARRNHRAHLLRIPEQANLRPARSEKPPQRNGRFRGTDAAPSGSSDR